MTPTREAAISAQSLVRVPVPHAAGPLATAAHLLATAGTGALPAVLNLVADASGAQAVELRHLPGPDGLPGRVWRGTTPGRRVPGLLPRPPLTGSTTATVDVALRYGPRVVGLLTFVGLDLVPALGGLGDVLALALAAAGTDPAALGAAWVQTLEDERADWAEALHDSAAQGLAAARMHLHGDIADATAAASAALRADLRRLRPRVSLEAGLAALADPPGAAGAGAEQVRVEVHTSAVGPLRPAGLPAQTADLGYRLAQAVVADAASRGATTVRIDVALTTAADPDTTTPAGAAVPSAAARPAGELVLRCSDDGARGPANRGLRRELTRWTLLGGRITTPPNGDLTARLRLPETS